jgi:hypothetical protein
MTIVGIVNPAAWRGEAAQVWARVRWFLYGPVETAKTEGAGHALVNTHAGPTFRPFPARRPKRPER